MQNILIWNETNFNVYIDSYTYGLNNLLDKIERVNYNTIDSISTVQEIEIFIYNSNLELESANKTTYHNGTMTDNIVNNYLNNILLNTFIARAL